MDLLIPQKRKTPESKVYYKLQFSMAQSLWYFLAIWPVLQSDPDLSEFKSDCPQLFAKRSRTLGNMLVRSHYIPERTSFCRYTGRGPKWGSCLCGGCSICKHMVYTDTFSDSSGRTQHKIVHLINCKTKGVLSYLSMWTYLHRYDHT